VVWGRELGVNNHLFGGGDGMKVITVSGSRKGVGKTRLCTFFLSHLEGRLAAIKFTTSERYKQPIITDDPKEVAVEGKDTCAFKSARAHKVIWVRTSREDLKKAASKALKLSEGCDVVVVEGGEVIEYLCPDVSVYLFSPSPHDKPSSYLAIKRADIVVVLGPNEYEGRIEGTRPGTKVITLKTLTDRSGLDALVSEVVQRLEKGRRLDDELLKSVPEARLSCQEAFDIAERLGVSPAEVGHAADRLGVKITHCRLGCF
jgi:molybdopterin-guanine dinucleotide biosynthesis protein